ncbi:MAG TPA: MG2 domain-containing protein [Candidatus Binatia bacterium]|nr:MG2 domain-containing protein [Candidatus Binatia bacterium]
MQPERSRTNRRLGAALGALIIAFAMVAPAAQAARPLLDTHQWDAYFALFARDAVVPWKKITVRLDTFSGAPVDFSAYSVDPAEVIVAGPEHQSRPLDTSHRTPAARWRFTPPQGYNFESNDVDVPLQNREGFFVIEARRGDAVQQVWLNVTRVGLVTKEGPDGILVYGTDLSNGRALPGMRVTWLLGSKFVYGKTESDGMLRWNGAGRPTFALAEWGNSKTFVSLLPVAPVPQAIVGVRADRGAVRAGETINVVGFARKRTAQEYRAAGGDIVVSLAGNGRSLVTQTLRLDEAGAFSGTVEIPSDAPAGDYAILATAAGATGGSTIHVDAGGDLRLTAAPGCSSPCPADAAIALAISARRGDQTAPNVDVRVRVVRSPHAFPPGEPEEKPRWGTTRILEQSLRTDANGHATITIPAPTDGLNSTYGIEVAGGSTTQTTRLVATSARYAISVEPDDTSVDVGAPIGIEVIGFDPSDGGPAANQSVVVKLSHGENQTEQTVTLDPNGHGHAIFERPELGANLITASMNLDGKTALDASEVTVAPQAIRSSASGGPRDLSVSVDRARYKPGEKITVTAQLPGAVGEALVTLDGARTYDAKVVPVRSGRAVASLDLESTTGDLKVGVVFVREGATIATSLPLSIDAPGHPRLTALAVERSTYAPGETARVTIRDGNQSGPATVAIRLADGRSTGPAGFLGAAGVLAVGASSTQTPSGDDAAWHAWVAPASSKAADIFGFDRPSGGSSPEPSLAVSAPQPLFWKVQRMQGNVIEVPLPRTRGRYVLSVLKIADEGDVGAAAATIVVQ